MSTFIHSALQKFSILCILAFIAVFISCNGAQKRDPLSYHDSLMATQARAAYILEQINQTLAQHPEQYRADQWDANLAAKLENVKIMGNCNNDSSLRLAVELCLKNYQQIVRQKAPEIAKLLEKPTERFNESDEARLGFLNDEVKVLAEKGFEQVQLAGKVFRERNDLNSGQNVPLRP